MRVDNIKFLKCAMVLCLILAGCNAQQTPRNGRVVAGKGKTEDLLAADEGAWSVQEETNDAGLIDPLEAHMRARRQVNPNETANNRRYTSKLSAADLYNEDHYRVMKLSSERSRSSQKIKEQITQESSLAGSTQKKIIANVPVPSLKPHFTPSEDTGLHLVENASPATMPKPSFKPSYGLNTRQFGQDTVVPRTKNAANIAHIENLRVGEHPGKTRIVVDVTNPAEFSYGIKNNTLQVDFKNAVWDAENLKKFNKNSLLSSYEAESGEENTHLTLTFSKSVKVLGAQRYSPNNTYQYYRIVIDIAAL